MTYLIKCRRGISGFFITLYLMNYLIKCVSTNALAFWLIWDRNYLYLDIKLCRHFQVLFHFHF